MILFVPNIHVINYLNATQQENVALKAEAIKNMEKGQYFNLLSQVSTRCLNLPLGMTWIQFHLLPIF
jgi:hypothetical protein